MPVKGVGFPERTSMPVSGGSGEKGIPCPEEVAPKCVVAGNGYMPSVLTADIWGVCGLGTQVKLPISMPTGQKWPGWWQALALAMV